MRRHQSFEILVHAITTVDRLQDLEALHPNLSWKSLQVIKKTLQATTQWATNIYSYPLKDHHISRFPLDNRSRLKEDAAMDSVFAVLIVFYGSNATQVFLDYYVVVLMYIICHPIKEVMYLKHIKISGDMKVSHNVFIKTLLQNKRLMKLSNSIEIWELKIHILKQNIQTRIQ